MLPNKLPIRDDQASRGLPTQEAPEKAMWDGDVKRYAGRDDEQFCCVILLPGDCQWSNRPTKISHDTNKLSVINTLQCH